MAKKPNYNIFISDIPAEPLEGMQKTITDLTNGVKPKNKEEEELLKEINAIKAKGSIIDLPLD